MNWNKVIRNIYYLIKRLFKGFRLFFSEIFKPTSFLKGEDFEKCLRKKVFKKEKYDLVMKTHDYFENSNDYIESSLYPDYLFRDRKNDKEFWVEAKYREKLSNGKLHWCKPYQFQRYKKIQNKIPVFIAIGYGGRPNNPKRIFLIPLKDIEYNALFLSFLENYEYLEKRKNIIDNLIDKIYDYKK